MGAFAKTFFQFGVALGDGVTLGGPPHLDTTKYAQCCSPKERRGGRLYETSIETAILDRFIQKCKGSPSPSVLTTPHPWVC